MSVFLSFNSAHHRLWMKFVVDVWGFFQVVSLVLHATFFIACYRLCVISCIQPTIIWRGYSSTKFLGFIILVLFKFVYEGPHGRVVSTAVRQSRRRGFESRQVHIHFFRSIYVQVCFSFPDREWNVWRKIPVGDQLGLNPWPSSCQAKAVVIRATEPVFHKICL